MDKFSKKMRRSGYSARVRKEVVTSALAAYRKMRKQEEEGVRPLNRPTTWLDSERSLAKASKKSSWSKAGWTAGEVARAPLIVSPLAGSQVIEEM